MPLWLDLYLVRSNVGDVILTDDMVLVVARADGSDQYVHWMLQVSVADVLEIGKVWFRGPCRFMPTLNERCFALARPKKFRSLFFLLGRGHKLTK